ncbi:MAG: S1 RNA-binding domain-containing protein, partial [Candidatus Omnitrophica bacterium]|nr:S1 RNA-binding domain-containing protein [Candidatus Omnitrophota bacterium]
MTETKLNLEQLYNESIKLIREGEIVSGRIVSVKNKEVFVDVGFKSEGLVSAHEFNQDDLQVGKELDFLIESLENDQGIMMLSREKVTRMQGWDKIIKNSKENDLIEGTVNRKVKGGFLVDVNGIEGFLPASLSAFKGMFEKDILGKQFKFKIIKINNLRRSIILSRRDAVQKEKEEARARIWQEIKIGEIH